MKPSIVRESFNVNCFAGIEICRLLVQKRINARALRTVVLVSSTSSKIGEKGGNVYCASKGAVDAFMRSLAVELAPTVRVNSILPGMTKTEMTEQWIESPSYKTVADRFPMGFGTPSDVVSVVEFLISNGAQWINGQQIVVDGGRTIT